MTATPATPKRITIRPQPGPQVRFLSTAADIAFYGGAAGGGKSWSLLFEPYRHHAVPRFRGVIFRRTAPEITAAGGLWEESFDLYGKLGAVPQVTRLRWDWPGGGSVRFGHLQYETDLLKFHSAQIPFIGWDELTTFTERQFVYMLSRNRSTCGVRPYVRGTCNPDADSWVANWVAWWIDQGTGYPIPERSGVVRWFVRDGEAMHWGATRAELADRYPGVEPKSFTFVPAKLSDNQVLMAKDPGYLANLQAQTSVDRERLLGGNWKVKRTGSFFDRTRVKLLPALPMGSVLVRYWDTASTAGEASANTAGVLLGKTPAGRFVVADCVAGRWSPAERDAVMLQTCHKDRGAWPGCRLKATYIERPGGFGAESVAAQVRMLAGFNVREDPVSGSSGSKDERCKPLSAQWEVGNVDVLAGEWTEAFLAELNAVPGNGKRDRADAAAGAFNRLTAAVDGGPPMTGDAGSTVNESLPDYTFR